ncbi:MAG TPA: oxidoreductase [Solirubrobacteraceae bacterium]|nr:oxidoreductase [Solirubrobacteraceae bacterium]
MADLPQDIRAFVAVKGDEGVDRGLRTIAADELGEGDVVVRVDCSSVNYKDALATIPKGQVARISPLVPGIDLAGTVVEGPGEGTEVLAHGYDLGVAHNGGYAEYARVPGEWVVPLPDGLSTTQAMAIGTAGFTAALAVARLERHGVQPDDGPVLVTGATGGVGSTAVSILAARGFEVTASTGKDARGYLESLGAADVISREDVESDGKPLSKQRWAAAVDSVGGAVLAGLFPQIRYGGAVAATGLTAGIKVETTVMPFILRSVALLGIDSVQTPMEERAEIWRRLAGDLRPPQLDDAIAREISLDELEPALDAILKGGLTGRTVVRVR